ncbi:MAG: hypothetical protein U0269_36460 [Polyangiales bacterium]
MRVLCSIAIGAALVHCPRFARAQNEQGPTVERVEVEDVLHPRAGRSALEITAHPSAAIAIGLSSDRPSRAELAPRFGAERDPVRCAAPCSLYLSAGVHRLSFDADTPYPWSADLALSPSGSRYVLRPHRVWMSALGGAMFVLGCAGSLLGPGVIVVNLWVGDRQQLGWAILGGSIAGALGAGLVVGGYFTVREGSPSVRPAPIVRAMLAPNGVVGVF